MKRTKFLTAEWPLSLQTIGNRLKARAFSEHDREGFIVDRLRQRSIEARFIEKVVTSESVEDPFGNTESFERTLYKQVKFVLATEYPQIHLIDPPRSVKLFINRLAQVMDFQVAIDSVQIRPEEWIEGLIASGLDLERNGAELSEVSVSEHTSAKIVFHSKKDIAHDIEDFLAGRAFSIDRIAVLFTDGRLKVQAQLSSDGSAKFSNDVPAAIAEMLRKNLPLTIPSTEG